MENKNLLENELQTLREKEALLQKEMADIKEKIKKIETTETLATYKRRLLNGVMFFADDYAMFFLMSCGIPYEKAQQFNVDYPLPLPIARSRIYLEQLTFLTGKKLSELFALADEFDKLYNEGQQKKRAETEVDRKKEIERQIKKKSILIDV
jgi:hypothetical protein